jgi:hypothetical protein
MLQWEKRLEELKKSVPKAKKKPLVKRPPVIKKDGGRFAGS